MTPDRYATDVVTFIDDLIRVNELGQPFRLSAYQREIDRAAFVFDAEGRLAWDTFVDARIKKGAKTFDNACRVVWWGVTQEAPNEILILANDQEQSQARVFATAARLFRNNPALAASVVSSDSRRLVLTNGTEIRALASEYAGAAGSNHGLTSWDELWAYTSERSRRLWEELTPVPTRRNSIRNITTYAGWDGESELLWSLYLAGVGPEEHPDGQATRIHPTLPLYLNRAARLLCLWDHEPRMPWQTPNYYASQRRVLRPNTYARLHENRWTSAESAFVSAEAFDACVEPGWGPLDPTKEHLLYVGVDASVKRDCTAVVAVLRDPVEDLVVLAQHRVWQPTPDHPVDFQAVEDYLATLATQYAVAQILVDPYQMAAALQRLRARGLPAQEYVQTPDRLVRMATTLESLIREHKLVVYADADLRAHLLAASAQETGHGTRLIKTTAARKIDLAIALAMAAHAATTAPVWAEPRLIALGG